MGVSGREWGAHMLVINVDLNSVRSASNQLTCTENGSFLIHVGHSRLYPSLVQAC